MAQEAENESDYDNPVPETRGGGTEGEGSSDGGSYGDGGGWRGGIPPSATDEHILHSPSSFAVTGTSFDQL